MSTRSGKEPVAAVEPDGQSRRQALKIIGAAALATPVIETMTGKDLLTISAQAQTVANQGVGGPFQLLINPSS